MQIPRGSVSAIAVAIVCFSTPTFSALNDSVADTTTQRPPDINYVVQQSARVTEADRNANDKYDYYETILQSDGSHRTYSVRMLYGSPYEELISINGEPLRPDEQNQEEGKLQEEISRRKNESPNEHARRVAEFQKEQTRDRRFMEEFLSAFNFKLLGERRLNDRSVYVVEATLRPDYRATDRDSKVLTGMRGQLYIDQKSYQWVKAEAQVVHPVSITGFLATVEPGTRFVLEKMPVEGNIWLPKHFSMIAKAEILSFIGHKKHEDVVYFNYRRATD